MPAVCLVVEGGIFRHPMTASLAAHCSAFLTRGLTGCDACYAGLADELGARWLTFDRRAHERIAGDGVSVDLWQGMPADW